MCILCKKKSAAAGHYLKVCTCLIFLSPFFLMHFLTKLVIFLYKKNLSLSHSLCVCQKKSMYACVYAIFAIKEFECTHEKIKCIRRNESFLHSREFILDIIIFLFILPYFPRAHQHIFINIYKVSKLLLHI